jgi:uncharacterized membrane protein
MNIMTKRDVADLILLWMALTLFMALLAAFVTFGAFIGMKENEYTDKTIAICFQSIHFVILIFINYMLFLKREWILNVVLSKASSVEINIPEGIMALSSYAFWIRLFGIFTFLTSSIAFFSHLVMDISTNRRFAPGTFWMMQSGAALVAALLALLVIWKSDWIAHKLGGNKLSNRVAGTDP